MYKLNEKVMRFYTFEKGIVKQVITEEEYLVQFEDSEEVLESVDLVEGWEITLDHRLDHMSAYPMEYTVHDLNNVIEDLLAREQEMKENYEIKLQREIEEKQECEDKFFAADDHITELTEHIEEIYPKILEKLEKYIRQINPDFLQIDVDLLIQNL